MSCLFICNHPWNDAFPNPWLQGLSTADFDHCPLLLTLKSLFKPQRRFRFENVWVRLEGFSETVTSAWHGAIRSTDPFINLHNKLSQTAKKLQSLASSLFSDIRLLTLIVHELIYQLDCARDCRDLTWEEHTFRNKLKVMSLGFGALDCCIWRQRSIWLKERECNSKFFHIKASARRRHNFIPSLICNGVEVTDQQNKEQCIWEHFNGLLGSYEHREASLNLAALCFPETNLSCLDNNISVEEITKAIFDLHPEKASGPDGYTRLFFRKCWDLIKNDLVGAVLHFQNLNT